MWLSFCRLLLDSVTVSPLGRLCWLRATELGGFPFVWFPALVYSTVGLCAGLKIRNESPTAPGLRATHIWFWNSFFAPCRGRTSALTHNHSFLLGSVTWNQVMGDRAARWHPFLLPRIAEGWDSGIFQYSCSFFLLSLGTGLLPPACCGTTVVLYCTPGQALPQMSADTLNLPS